MLVNDTNLNLSKYLDTKVDLIYADMIYENKDFSWVNVAWDYLKDNGIFIIQTDWHTQVEAHLALRSMKNSTFVNHLVWKNEWGNHPKNKFHQCYDDIIIYCKGTEYKFNANKVQVPKATVAKGLNPSGRETKTATCWIDDCVLTTTATERVKKDDGHLVRWQKPLKLMDRIFNPFIDKGDYILDLFAGSATVGEWSILNKMKYLGFENDTEVFKLAQERIIMKELGY